MNESNLIPCMENSIQMMQLVKSGNGKNIVHLTNLFRDVRHSRKDSIYEINVR